MAPTLLGLEKLGLENSGQPRMTAAEIRAAQAQQGGIPKISPAPPPGEEGQIGNMLMENEREMALNRPGAGWVGRGGQIANLAASFLHGLSQGRAQAQIMRYQKMRQHGDNLATAYGVARQTLLPLENEAYQHRAPNGPTGKYLPSLGFSVDPKWFGSAAGITWYANYQKHYNAVAATKSSYVDYIKQNQMQDQEGDKGKRRHRSKASDFVHKAEEVGMNMLRGGPQIPQGFTDAAYQMVNLLPVGHTPQEMAAYSQEGEAPAGKLQVSYQTLMGPDGKPHRYEVNAATGAKRDLGLAETKAPGSKVSYQTLLGPDGKSHRYAVSEETGAKTDLGIVPTKIGAAPHVSFQSLVGPDGKLHRYEVDEATGKKTDLGLAATSGKGAASGANARFALQQTLSDVRNQVSHEQSTIQALEGKLSTVKEPGAFSNATGYALNFMVGTPLPMDPQATIKSQIAQHKSLLATLMMRQKMLEGAAANVATMTPEQVQDAIDRANRAGMSPAPEQAKTASLDEITRYAHQTGMSIDQAKQAYRNAGFQVPR